MGCEENEVSGSMQLLKRKSVFEKELNLIYTSSLCIAWQYTKLDVLAKVSDSEKRKRYKQTVQIQFGQTYLILNNIQRPKSADTV